MIAAADAVDTGAGILFIVKNYEGDVMNFDMAREMSGRAIETVITDDDVAVENSLSTTGRRGTVRREGATLGHVHLSTNRTARCRTAQEDHFGFSMTPSSQESQPRGNRGRFRSASNGCRFNSVRANFRRVDLCCRTLTMEISGDGGQPERTWPSA